MMKNSLNPLMLGVLLCSAWLLIACNPQAETEQATASNEAPPPTLAATAVPVAADSEVEAVEEPTLVPTHTPTPSPTPVPVTVESADTEELETEVSEIVEEPTGGAAPGEWTADSDLIPFDTFEFWYELNLVNDGGTPQIVGLTIQASKPLSMTAWIPNISGLSDPDMLQLNDARLGVFEDSSYMFIPSFGCLWSNEGADEILPFNSNNFLAFEEQPDAKFVGTETINGLETFVYSIGAETLTAEMPPEAKVQEASGTFNLYPLPSGENIIIRSDITMISNYDMLNETYSESAESVVTNFKSGIRRINEPLEITIPAECEQQANNFAYPIYEGGQIQGSMPGLSVLSIPGASVEDVATWYQAEMVNAGWAISSVINLGPAINIDFTKDGQTVTISIIEDPNTGDIAVTFVEI